MILVKVIFANSNVEPDARNLKNRNKKDIETEIPQEDKIGLIS